MVVGVMRNIKQMLSWSQQKKKKNIKSAFWTLSSFTLQLGTWQPLLCFHCQQLTGVAGIVGATCTADERSAGAGEEETERKPAKANGHIFYANKSEGAEGS